MSLTWDKTPGEAFEELTTAYIAAIRRGVRAIADRRAPEIEAWMKAEAIWIDRTSNARQTLYAEVNEIAMTAVTILVSHGVDYGTYLELSHGGAYAIVTPALDRFIPIIWSDVQAMLRD